MSTKEDKSKNNDSFDKFINSLIKCLYNFLEQLENYYQAYLSIVLSTNLRETLNHDHEKVESTYNNLKDRLTEFLEVITKDSAEIKLKTNEIKSLKQNSKLYKMLLRKASINENSPDMINSITSNYEKMKGQLNKLLSVYHNKLAKLNNFKFYLKSGSITYQSYSDEQLFTIPIKEHVKDLKKIIQNIGVDKELEKNNTTLQESLHEIQSLSSYSDFISLQSIQDTSTDAGSLHTTSTTKKRKEHSTPIENGSEPAIDPQNVKRNKTISDFDDQIRNILNNLPKKQSFRKHRTNQKRVSSSKFLLENIMPEDVPNLMNIGDQDNISKEHYDSTLQILEEKLMKVDEVDNYLIVHENDKLCKKYHGLKNELDDLEENLRKTKEQVSHIKDVRKISGDNSVNTKHILDKEREKLKKTEYEINDKKSKIKGIQKLIRHLDKNDYDLQNYKHILYNGMRKLIRHWLIQIQNELDQEIDAKRQIKLQDEIDKAKEKMMLIDADINDMYLSYNKRKKKRMVTDFDYKNFCENSTFTECLYRYDKFPSNDNNDNTSVMG